MYIPTFQGLTATDLVRTTGGATDRYPFDVPHLTFYRARNAIYYLCRGLAAMKASKGDHAQLTVLMPEYNSGNEVLAVEAAGAAVSYYPVGADGQVDPAQLERICGDHPYDVLYVIHYLGWPQPIEQLADLSRRLGMWLIEDCALALLSDLGTRPLGSFGDWSVFCLYKTLPLPNGACLVENGAHLPALDDISLRQAGFPSVIGRTAELIVRNIRSRSDGLGAAMESVKRAAGRAAGAMDVPRAKVGDIGFSMDEIDLAMSEISSHLIKRLNLDDIRERRIANYLQLARQLERFVTPLHARLPEGACPLLFPILVPDKPAVAALLRSYGVDVLEFWNYGADGSRAHEGERTRFLRDHVLGLPIHQDLTPRHIDYIAAQAVRLNLRMS
jgi:dTDP-4-amino-4,6-dideoxygalactose transaminase